MTSTELVQYRIDSLDRFGRPRSLWIRPLISTDPKTRVVTVEPDARVLERAHRAESRLKDLGDRIVEKIAMPYTPLSLPR